MREKSRNSTASVLAAAAALICCTAWPAAAAGAPAPAFTFHFEEATIASVHAALKAGTLSCHALVQHYLDRIEANDKRGPAINAIITVNPAALAHADELDAQARGGGWAGALHCVPVIVKDNFNTAGLETTAGSIALKGSVPAADAFQVRRIRDAGAVILAKANLSEFAASGDETVSSRLPGYTKNPYALDRVTAGSSGGTAAAVAANFGLVGLGSDTENSIRGPAAHTSLVGFRSTMGMTSRAGIVPLDLDRDIGGPITRTVADAAALLDVIAGEDPSDPVTAASRGKLPDGGFAQALDAQGLRGARIGVLRVLAAPSESDPQVLALFERALAALRAQGAVLVDPLPMPQLARPRPAIYDAGERLVWTRCSPFKYQLHDYLQALGAGAPIHDLSEIQGTGRFHPSIGWLINGAAAVPVEPHGDAACQPVRDGMRAYRALIDAAFSDHHLNALVYPSWSRAPRLIGDEASPTGKNSGRLASPAAYPAVTVPMGFSDKAGSVAKLPAGLEFLGLPWSDANLLRYAYAYEQATHLRRPPAFAVH